MVKYVIEHLEPRLYKWCMLEYQHISKIVGKKNLVITNLRTDNAVGKMKGLGKCYKESVVELGFGKELVLDPITDKTLTTKDCEKFDYLIFGGILGDYPMRRRTKSMLSKKLKAPVRNLGRKQMPTDNAVYAAKLIADGKKFSDIEFMDGIEILVGDGLSVEMPFRYVMVGDRPLMSEEVFQLILKKGF